MVAASPILPAFAVSIKLSGVPGFVCRSSNQCDQAFSVDSEMQFRGVWSRNGSPKITLAMIPYGNGSPIPFPISNAL